MGGGRGGRRCADGLLLVAIGRVIALVVVSVMMLAAAAFTVVLFVVWSLDTAVVCVWWAVLLCCLLCLVDRMIARFVCVLVCAWRFVGRARLLSSRCV